MRSSVRARFKMVSRLCRVYAILFGSAHLSSGGTALANVPESSGASYIALHDDVAPCAAGASGSDECAPTPTVLIQSHLAIHARQKEEGRSCDLAVLDAREPRTIERFEEEFRGRKPALMLGLADHWPALSWSAGKWHQEMQTSDVPEIPQVGSRRPSGCSGDCKEDVAGMVFQTTPHDAFMQSLLKREAVQVPHLFRLRDLGSRVRNYAFSLGDAGAGTVYHAHGDAWLVLLSGAKKWYFVPPEITKGALFPGPQGETPADREAGNMAMVATGAALHCTQRMAETVYVPAGWMHATFNMRNLTLGVGVQ